MNLVFVKLPIWERVGESVQRLLKVAAVIVGVLLVAYFIRSLSQPKFVLAKVKELPRVVVADAIAYRNEELLYAPIDGNIDLLVPDGVRVSAKTAVAMVGSYPIYANKAGTVSWGFDGLENVLGVAVLMTLKHDFLKDWDKPYTKVKTGSSVFRGEVVGKLVDNYAWHLLIFHDLNKNAKKGEKLTLVINGSSYTGTIAEVLPDKRVSVAIEVYDSKVASFRVLRDVKVYKEPLKGIIVPEELLIETAEGSYLTIRYKNREKKQPVRVVGRWNGQVVVDGVPEGAYVEFLRKRY